MKKILLFLSVSFSIISAHAQVGLLSSNNNKKFNKTESDSSLPKLPPIGSGVYSSKIKSADTSYSFYVPLPILSFEKIEFNAKEAEELRALLEKERKKGLDKSKTYDSLKIRLDSIDNDNRNLKERLLDQGKKDMLLNSIIKENYFLKYQSFKNKIDSVKNVNTDLDRSLHQSNFLTRHSPIDSIQKIISFEKFNRAMAVVYSDIEILMEKNERNIRKLDQLIEKLENTKLPDTIKNQVETNLYLENQWNKLANDTSSIFKLIREDTAKYRIVTSDFDKIIKDNVAQAKKTEEESKETEFGAFPQLTSILGKKEFIPQMQLYGKFFKENFVKSSEANIGLAFAPTSTPDTANLYSIFIPAASKFQIFSNFTFSFLANSRNDDGRDTLLKRLGILLNFSYTGKNLLFDTTKSNKTISTSVLYASAGLEFGVLPKRLSIYANINTATLMDKIDDFKAATNIDSKFFGYIDCGAKFYLDPTPLAKADGLFIYSNINFIINSGDVKRVTKSNDLVIPSIQVGIVKSLGKF